MSDNQWTPDRPKELITLVLRAGMFGMLKCVDGAWRELSKGHVNDVRIVKFSHPPVWSLNYGYRLRIGKERSVKCRYSKEFRSTLPFTCSKRQSCGSNKPQQVSRSVS
jgi:hypothetical protein